MATALMPASRSGPCLQSAAPDRISKVASNQRYIVLTPPP